jgi:precorrin-6B methylase 2
MSAPPFVRRTAPVLCLLAVTLLLVGSAQPEGPEYTPRPGQAGKDVIWLPTERPVVEKMLDLANVTSRDYVIDLGSGDGRTVIAAARRGARALGVEYNPDLVSLAERNAQQEGVADRAKFVQGDLFEVDLSQATVITMFLLPDINLRLMPRILSLKPGTRIVSNSFDMGDWAADAAESVEGDCPAYCTAYLWLVPARVDGVWKLPEGELMLGQSYQKVSGVLRSASGPLRISEASLRGDRLTFTAGGTLYAARVAGDAMEGTARNGSTTKKWSATRSGELVRVSR